MKSSSSSSGVSPPSATDIISSSAIGFGAPSPLRAPGAAPLNKPSGAWGTSILPCSQASSCSYHSTVTSFFSMIGFAAFRDREMPSPSLILPTHSFLRTCSAGIFSSTWPCWKRMS